MVENKKAKGCSCCSCFLTLIITPISLWLSLHAQQPRLSIQYFYLPALNTSLANSSSLNSTLYFNLKLQNPNKVKGIYYDAINLTFSYLPNKTNVYPIGNFTIPGFYQGFSKKAVRYGDLESGGLDWKVVLGNKMVVFRVDLATVVRYKMLLVVKSKRHKISVGENVEVNDQGSKASMKDIKLKSSARKLSKYYSYTHMVALISVVVLIA